MAEQPTRSIREVLLDIVYKQHAHLDGGSHQQSDVLSAAADVLCPPGRRETTLEEAILTQWGELFRTGLLAWGANLANPNQPHFHLTERGRQALANATRDPSNPAGYMRHLEGLSTSKSEIGLPLNAVAKSYIIEALECYVAGLFKAAAVMVGCAAEALVLEVRDFVVADLEQGGSTAPTDLKDWQIKRVTVGLAGVFERIEKKTHRELRARFDAQWGALTHEIRTTRNDAGHPTSVDPVTPDSVHASLLLFPVLVALCDDLIRWTIDNL